MKIAVVGKLISNAVKKYFINIKKRRAFIKGHINLAKKQDLYALAKKITTKITQPDPYDFTLSKITYDFWDCFVDLTRYYNFYFQNKKGIQERFICFVLLKRTGEFIMPTPLTNKELRGLINFEYVKKDVAPKDDVYKSCIKFSNFEAANEVIAVILASYEKIKSKRK